MVYFEVFFYDSFMQFILRIHFLTTKYTFSGMIFALGGYICFGNDLNPAAFWCDMIKCFVYGSVIFILISCILDKQMPFQEIGKKLFLVFFLSGKPKLCTLILAHILWLDTHWWQGLHLKVLTICIILLVFNR